MTPGGPPVATIAADIILYRVHAVGRAARWYGRRDATWRWDDPAGRYGVLYLGLAPLGPFAEALLRRPDRRAVLWSEIAKRRLARFRTTRPLALAQVHGPGLAWFATTAAGVAADPDPAASGGAYRATQAISASVFAGTALDGIQYRSRLDSDELCVALFDRADAALEPVADGEPIGRAWAEQVLAARGYHLVDP